MCHFLCCVCVNSEKCLSMIVCLSTESCSHFSHRKNTKKEKGQPFHFSHLYMHSSSAFHFYDLGREISKSCQNDSIRAPKCDATEEKCPRCTFDNDVRAPKCAMCNHPFQVKIRVSTLLKEST